MPNLDETGSVVLEKKNSKLLLVNVFLLFRNYLPLEEGVTQTNLNPLHPRMLCVKFG